MTTTSATTGDTTPGASDRMEDVESFRARARAWIGDTLPRKGDDERFGLHYLMSDEEELERVSAQRQLQRVIFDGGFAGITVPREYGGQGLTVAHQAAFNEELTGYESPLRLQIPTRSPCLAVILQFGTHEQ